MKKFNFTLQLGRWQLQGIWAVVLGLILAIPIIALALLIVGVVLSIAGVAVTFALGAAGIAIVVALVVAAVALVIGLLSLALPQKWRDKLGIRIHINRHTKEATPRPRTTPDGKPIVDVDFKETDAKK